MSYFAIDLDFTIAKLACVSGRQAQIACEDIGCQSTLFAVIRHLQQSTFVAKGYKADNRAKWPAMRPFGHIVRTVRAM